MKNNFYRDPLTGNICVERRSGFDRRDHTTIPRLFRVRKLRRKSGGRREIDNGGYVDIYDSRSWGIAIAIMTLSLLDAVLTGLHLLIGSARELNPILDAVIHWGGMAAFFGVKAALTIIPMAIILLHKEWSLGRYAARLCLWSYILLCLYHLYLALALQKLPGYY
jgi:hypothetical protein